MAAPITRRLRGVRIVEWCRAASNDVVKNNGVAFTAPASMNRLSRLLVAAARSQHTHSSVSTVVLAKGNRFCAHKFLRGIAYLQGELRQGCLAGAAATQVVVDIPHQM
ncbi:hypothetical protein E2C01_078311 [Portunus trituberculatus]|uniref:Uncharacterized protein n=1 Tax=Portunus trituberculatus TaxID=210409 RepID=A0A5B7INH7_PORTR|nr:hypothetical protein [Portunus trituberculatus]